MEHNTQTSWAQVSEITEINKYKGLYIQIVSAAVKRPVIVTNSYKTNMFTWPLSGPFVRNTQATKKDTTKKYTNWPINLRDNLHHYV